MWETRGSHGKDIGRPRATGRRPPGSVARLIALLALGTAAATGATAQTSLRTELLDTAVLASPRLVESSGVATSVIAPGVYWTHNDSGDGPFLYAIDATGRDLGAVRVAGAGAVDWEDLAAGPCLVVPGRCLYAADIGDNGRRRSHVVVYRLHEPPPPKGPADTLGVVPLLDSLVLVYPDGPHDAEALVVTSAGTLLLVTKDRFGPAVLFRAAAGTDPAPRALTRIGTLAMATGLLTGRLATGAALAPDERTLVVRTYVSLHFFRLRGDSVPQPLSPPRGIPIPVVEPQGEGVAFDGPDRLVLTSERGSSDHACVSRLRILWPSGAARAPTH